VRRYPIVVEPVAADEGEGALALVPDLPGCTSDSASREHAVANVQYATETRIEAAHGIGHAISAPSRHLVLEAVQ
jgi:antitoxin HicB